MLGVLGDLVEDVVVWLKEPLRHATDTDVSMHRTRGGSAAKLDFDPGHDDAIAILLAGASRAADLRAVTTVAFGFDAPPLHDPGGRSARHRPLTGAHRAGQRTDRNAR